LAGALLAGALLAAPLAVVFAAAAFLGVDEAGRGPAVLAVAPGPFALLAAIRLPRLVGGSR
jgi:hypothetical protein